MSGHRRHHTTPEGFQKLFADNDNLLWTFNKKTKEYKKLHPNEISVSTEFYSFEGQDSKKDKTIETELFGKEVEPAGLNAIRSLVAEASITEQKKSDLAVFLAFQYLRTPKFKIKFEEMYGKFVGIWIEMRVSQKETFRRDLEHIGITPDDNLVEEMVDYFRKGKDNIVIHKNEYLTAMLKYSKDFYDTFMCMNWTILEAPSETGFILSDAPAFIHGEKYPMVRLPLELSEISMPLTSKYALLLRGKGHSIQKAYASKKATEILNRRTAHYSHIYIMGNNDMLIRRVVDKLSL